jgi:hypothetical protein
MPFAPSVGQGEHLLLPAPWHEPDLQISKRKTKQDITIDYLMSKQLASFTANQES